MVNLNNPIETATHDVLQRESLRSRRTLCILAGMASGNPFLDGAIQTGPDEPLLNPGSPLVHTLLALVIMRTQDNLSMKQLG